jgi:hypothetical protein
LPPKEAETPYGKIWRLNHCLYGLNDAARQFYDSVVELLESCGCKQSQLDPAFIFKQHEGKLIGIVASHIDDFLHCGNELFEHGVMKKLRTRFLAGKLEQDHFRYVGFGIEQTHEGITLDQNRFVEEIEPVRIAPQRSMQKQNTLNTGEMTQLRGIVGKLNWAVQGSRPDMAFEMVELSTKFRNGTVQDLLRAVKSIRKLKEEESKIYFPKLGNIKSWRVVVYSDAAHANLADGVSSMGAHVVLMADEDGKCCTISWQARKIKRVVRSTLAAEALALQEGLEDSIYVKRMLQEIMNLDGNIPIVAYNDNRSVVDNIHSTKLVDDKRLRIDIGALKESLRNGELTSVNWCPGSAQIANCMTKKGAAANNLLSVIQTGKFICSSE